VTRMIKYITNVSFYDLTTGEFYIIDNMNTDKGSVGYTLTQHASTYYTGTVTPKIKMESLDPLEAVVKKPDNTPLVLTVDGTAYGTHDFRQIPSMSLIHIDDNRVSTIGEWGFFRNINGTWDGIPGQGGTVRFVEYVPGYGCAFWITDNTNY
jgi:hypothetical protein